MHSVYVVYLHISVDFIKISSSAQQCFYSKFMSPSKIKCTYVFMLNSGCFIETK